MHEESYSKNHKVTVQQDILFFKKWSYWLNRSLKFQRFTKMTLKQVKILFFLFFVVILPSETMSPKLRGAKVALFQNSPGQRLRSPKLRKAGVQTQRVEFAFNICPAEFWTPQPLPAEFGPSNFALWSFEAM